MCISNWIHGLTIHDCLFFVLPQPSPRGVCVFVFEQCVSSTNSSVWDT